MRSCISARFVRTLAADPRRQPFGPEPLALTSWRLGRDLKPENVLLGANGVVKLSDFGLGYLCTSSLHDGVLQTTCGTPNYVAPEVLMRQGYLGAPADIWSLGQTLFRYYSHIITCA